MIEPEIDEQRWAWMQFAHPWSVNPADFLRDITEIAYPGLPLDYATFAMARANLIEESL